MGLGLIRSFSLASSGFFSELDASLSVDNLGDVVAYDQCGLPQPGRTIRVAVRMR
jgi:iron complex outermembrane receptor protein